MSQSNGLLAPGMSLVGKLHFPKKFLLLGTAFMIPVIVLLVLYISTQKSNLDFSAKELVGLKLIEPARQALQPLQKSRGTAQIVIGTPDNAEAKGKLAKLIEQTDAAFAKVDSVSQEVGGQLQTGDAWNNVRQHWNTLKSKPASGTPAESFNSYTQVASELISFIGLVADQSNLTLDPEVDTFYLMDAITVRLPAISELGGITRARSSGIAAAHSISIDQRIELSTNLRLMRDHLTSVESGFDKVFKAVPELRTTLQPSLKKNTESINGVEQMLRTELFNAAAITIAPTAVFAKTSEAVEAAYGTFDLTLPVLRERLEKRVARINSEIWMALIISAIALFASLYIFLSTRKSIDDSIDVLIRSAQEISHGNLDNSVKSLTQDEIGALGKTLDNMRRQLKHNIDTERELSQASTRIKIALDNVSTGVMIADNDRNIIYANRAVTQLLRAAESDIRKQLPSFSADKLVGTNIDSFHKNPQHQARLLATFNSMHVASMEIGGRYMTVTANPVIDSNNQRLGSVAEWKDRTAEVHTEQELAEIVNAAAAGDLGKRLNLSDKQGFYLALGQNLNNLLQNTETALTSTSKTLEALARGDLTQHIESDFQGIFAELKAATNTTIDRLRDVVGGIKMSSDAINIAAREIASGNADLSSRTEEQASSLEETSSSMEQLNSTVKQNASNALEANDLARNASAVAQRGGEMVRRVVNTMEDIQNSSKKIADIIGVIDSIAFQTNILALNAAVEAARAGEQGRGFAVVASEVRNLAQRSATAAKEIKQLIDDSVSKISIGGKQVHEAGSTMDEVVSSFEAAAALVTSIADAAREQSQGIEQVTTAVGQMDEITQQNAALVEQAAAAAESLEEQARGLVDAVSMFRLQDRPVLAGITHNTQRSPARTLGHSRSAALPAPATRGGSSGIKLGSKQPVASSEDEWEEF